MAGKPAVKVTGAVEFGRAVRKMRGDLTDTGFHRSPAEIVRDKVRDRAPRVSGALVDSVAIELLVDGAGILAGSSAVPYAGVIEYGWDERGIEAQHYLSGGLDDAAGEIHAAYAAEVGALVERVGRES